ncbi:MAG: DUF2335 domain-containing protein [Candidatus Magnetoovum sp. WYHC-5]|nr:DUF2335 domain-containing protein [Candidatus Magnetoovum sp. WYHC-5]
MPSEKRTDYTTVSNSVADIPQANKKIDKFISISSSTFLGPLPHPELLKQYDEICPGFATEIMEMAKEESKHRRDMEMKAIGLDEKEILLKADERKRGQRFGLIIGLGGLSIAFAATYIGSDVVGGIIGGSIIVGLVGVFVMGRKITEKDEKTE